MNANKNYQFIIRFFLFLLLSILPMPLHANGGPVRWTGAGPLGGLVPAKTEGVFLEREDLTLTIPDAYTYQAHAIYHLQKTSVMAQTILFGLPIIVPRSSWEEDASKEEKQKVLTEERKKIIETAQGVELKLGDMRFPCRPVDSGDAIGFMSTPVLSFPLPRSPDKEITNAIINKTDTNHYGYINDYLGKTQTIRAWCVAEVALPAQSGPLILDLRYKGSLVFSDEMTSKSPLTIFDSRYLVYSLFPAQSWATEGFIAEASLDLGPFSGDVKKSFPEAIEKAGKLRWRLKKEDLAGAILVDLDKKNISFHELATWNRTAESNARLELNATSDQFLPNYPAAHAVDGKAETAWCFSDKTGKPNAEITLQIPPAELKRLRGKSCSRSPIYMAIGYLKNKKLYESNGKILDAELISCDGKQQQRFQYASYSEKHKWIDYRDAWLKSLDAISVLQTGCIKIHVLETMPASGGHTCISEIIPIPDCFGAVD